MAKGRWWRRARGQAARAEVVAVQGAGDHAVFARAGPGRRCSRSASQAPPDQMPTRAASGRSSRRTPAQFGVQRLGIELQCGVMRARRFAEILVEDQRRRRPRQHHAPLAVGLGGGVALVHLVHRQAKRPCSWRAKRGRAGCCRAARRRGGRARPPPARRAATRDQPAMAAKRASPSAATVVSGWAWRSRLLPVATPTRRVPKSKARNDWGAHGRWRRALLARGAGQACPASCEACAGRCPAATAPGRSAAPPACRR
jgi:hypothetical protein